MKNHGEIRDFAPKAIAGHLARLVRNRYLVAAIASLAVSFFVFLAVETILAKYLLKEHIDWRRWAGATAEAPIRNVPRAAGESHYGISRTFNVLLDIVTIRFLTKYFTRPMHFFGRLGLPRTALGGLILIRTYFESQGRRIYAVRDTLGNRGEVASIATASSGHVHL